MRAADMFRRGRSQADVARALGVSAESASEWYRLWSTRGRRVLAGAERAGRLPKLSDRQLDEVVEALKKGPRVLDMATERKPSATTENVHEGRERSTGELKWTATAVDLAFGSHSQLRAHRRGLREL